MSVFDTIRNIEQRAKTAILDAAEKYIDPSGTNTPFGGKFNMAEVITKKKEQNPQFDYLFYGELPDLSVPTTTPTNQTNEIKQTIPIDASDINHRIYTINAPNKMYDTHKNIDASKWIHTAGHSDVGAVTLVVDELEDGASMTYFNNWMAMVKNSDGTLNMPAQYKRNFRVVRMTANFIDTMVTEYYGAFPSSIDTIQYSNDASGILQLNVTLTVDDVKHIPVSPSTVRKLVESSSDGIINGRLDSKTPIGLNVSTARKFLKAYGVLGF